MKSLTRDSQRCAFSSRAAAASSAAPACVRAPLSRPLSCSNRCQHQLQHATAALPEDAAALELSAASERAGSPSCGRGEQADVEQAHPRPERAIDDRSWHACVLLCRFAARCAARKHPGRHLGLCAALGRARRGERSTCSSSGGSSCGIRGRDRAASSTTAPALPGRQGAGAHAECTGRVWVGQVCHRPFSPPAHRQSCSPTMHERSWSSSTTQRWPTSSSTRCVATRAKGQSAAAALSAQAAAAAKRATNSAAAPGAGGDGERAAAQDGGDARAGKVL